MLASEFKILNLVLEKTVFNSVSSENKNNISMISYEENADMFMKIENKVNLYKKVSTPMIDRHIWEYDFLYEDPTKRGRYLAHISKLCFFGQTQFVYKVIVMINI